MHSVRILMAAYDPAKLQSLRVRRRTSSAALPGQGRIAPLEVKLAIGPFTAGGPHIPNHMGGPRTLRPGDVGDDLLLVVKVLLPPDTEGSGTGTLLIGPPIGKVVGNGGKVRATCVGADVVKGDAAWA